jgi:GT2 family glycosyltransferase
VLDLNASADTIRAVRSVLNSGSPVHRVLVLMNGSTPEHREAVRGELSANEVVSVYESLVNLGFAGGVNHLFRKLTEQVTMPSLVLLLNSDAEVEPQTIERLSRAVLEDGRVGIAGPRVLRMGTEREIAADGAAVIPWLMQQRFRHAGRRDSEVKAGPPRRVPFVAGTCMLVRTSLFRQLNGFDERYFAYFEDWDMCLRAEQLGFECRHVPGAIAWHESQKTQGSRRRFFHFLMTRNRWLMAQAHLSPGVRWLVFFPYFVGVRVLANFLRNLFKGDIDSAYGVALGIMWLAAPARLRSRFWPRLAWWRSMAAAP